MPSPSSAELIATLLFSIAVLHSFLIKRFQHLAGRYPQGSVGENFFHLMGEVEIVFGFWAGVFILCLCGIIGVGDTIIYTNSLDLKEPAFVFAIMAIASTKPIVVFTSTLISRISKVTHRFENLAYYLVALTLGPLLGSFITEPAAMTVIALVLRERFFEQQVSMRFKYLTLAALFVNVSIGGTLTHFAAPPVLMVAQTWGWDTPFMFFHFGWKAIIAVCVNTLTFAFILRKEFRWINPQQTEDAGIKQRVPFWLTAVHIAFLAMLVATSHYITVFLGIFLFFLGVTTITREFQDEIKLRESLLVGFFLGGLVILGQQQHWWLQPLLGRLNEFSLFLGATILTAFTDNAALTFLGSQVHGLSDSLKYSLVSGAVAGGGLSVIANAPNPVGFAVLKDQFGEEGISPIALLLSALFPTTVAMVCFWFLP